MSISTLHKDSKPRWQPKRCSQTTRPKDKISNSLQMMTNIFFLFA